MKFNLLPDKKKAEDLTPHVDHIMVDDSLWRVIRTERSMGNPPRMLTLAYWSHDRPQSLKFHAVGHEERFDVFLHID